MNRLRWDEVEADFRNRTSNTLRRYLIHDGRLVDVIDEFDGSFNRHLSATDVDRRVRKAFEDARTLPEGSIAMACYVHSRCLEAWEGTTRWPLIERVLVASGPPEDLLQDSAAERHLVKLILQHARSVNDAMDVEGGLNCLCPDAIQRRAGRVLVAAKQTLDGLIEAAQSPEFTSDIKLVRRAMEYIRTVASTDETYFSMIVEAATATIAMIDRPSEATSLLNQAITHMCCAEASDALRGDVYKSELRAHRITLQELVRRIDSPRIHVDQGRVTYCYSFAFRDLDSSKVLKTLRRDDLLAWDLLEIRPLDVLRFEVSEGLSDMWESSAPDGRGYRGVRIGLPPITIHTTESAGADGGERRRLQADVEVRLSELGNHYVRMSTDIFDGHPHYVAQAIRRGSDQMGDETVTVMGVQRTWNKVFDYAVDLIKAVDARVRIAAQLPDDRDDQNPYFHAVVSLRNFSIVRNGDEAVQGAGTDLLREDVLGSSLFWQPVNQAAGSLEEWVRYPKSSAKNLMRYRGFKDDLILQTTNTTVIAMPGKPSFLITTYEEGAEFIATLRVLIDAWKREVAEYVSKASEELGNIAKATPRPGRRPRPVSDELLRRLEKHQSDLAAFVTDRRADLARLKSPDLCKTVINREYLDQLWQSASLEAEELDLESYIARANDLVGRGVTVASVMEQRRQQRLQANIGIVTTFVALTGAVGFLTLVNSAFGFGHRAAVLEVFATLMFALLVALLPGFHKLVSGLARGERQRVDSSQKRT